jgi:hypothetical protein
MCETDQRLGASADNAVHRARYNCALAVLFNPTSGTFVLNADHGPVQESQMTDFFARTADVLLNQL